MTPTRLFSEAAAALEFEPVPLRYRRDGWTPARQVAFVAALCRTRCILAACREVGVSAAAAYKLYRHPAAASFRRVWQAALAGPGRAWSPSTSAGPSTSAPHRQIRAPFVAVALWPMPNMAAQRDFSQPAISAASSTSAEPNGGCRTRRTHQHPRSRELPAFANASADKPESEAPERPAYSLEAFARIVRASRRAPAK